MKALLKAKIRIDYIFILQRFYLVSYIVHFGHLPGVRVKICFLSSSGALNLANLQAKKKVCIFVYIIYIVAFNASEKRVLHIKLSNQLKSYVYPYGFSFHRFVSIAKDLQVENNK